jgi:hypothetical protein
MKLIVPTIHEEQLVKSRDRLSAMIRRRFEQQESSRLRQQAVQDLSLSALRRLVKSDKEVEKAVKQAKTAFGKEAKSGSGHTRQTHLRPRPLNEMATILAPPNLFPWQTSQTTGSDAGVQITVDPSSGQISLVASAGGTTAYAAGALGGYFQPQAANDVAFISSFPSVNYDLQTWTFLDWAYANGFVGLYVGEYTLDGQGIATLVDQQISLSTIGAYEGNSSGYPLNAQIFVDNDHFYEVWVWAGANAGGAGWSAFWGGAGLAQNYVTVPSIVIYSYG